MGAIAQKITSITDLEAALKASQANERSTVILIDIHPLITAEVGGH